MLLGSNVAVNFTGTATLFATWWTGCDTVLFEVFWNYFTWQNIKLKKKKFVFCDSGGLQYILSKHSVRFSQIFLAIGSLYVILVCWSLSLPLSLCLKKNPSHPLGVVCLCSSVRGLRVWGFCSVLRISSPRTLLDRQLWGIYWSRCSSFRVTAPNSPTTTLTTLDFTFHICPSCSFSTSLFYSCSLFFMFLSAEIAITITNVEFCCLSTTTTYLTHFCHKLNVLHVWEVADGLQDSVPWYIPNLMMTCAIAFGLQCCVTQSHWVPNECY